MKHRGWLRKIILKIAYAIIAHDPITKERDRLLRLHTTEFLRATEALQINDQTTADECRATMKLIRERTLLMRIETADE